MSSPGKNPQRPNRPAGKDATSTAQAANPSDVLRGDDQVARETTPGEFPIWLVVVLGLLFFWGEVYLDGNAGGFNPGVYSNFGSIEEVAKERPPDPNRDYLAMGKSMYGACVPCHQPSGLGTPGLYPPLAGSEWVLGSPARLIRIPLHGLSGPISVGGQMWNAQMGPIGAGLEDDQLGAVLSYIRQEWGNQAPIISPEEVKAVRAETANRRAMWTAEELLKIP